MEKGERILVPLDGLECSENILPRVQELVNGHATQKGLKIGKIYEPAHS